MIEAGRQVAALAADPNWTHEAFARMTLPSPEAERALHRITDGLSWFFGGAVAAVLLARIARRAWRRRHGVVRIGYADGRWVEVTPGTSVLEASRMAGIPHASVCGGRGRCSTCRVRVRGEVHSIDPPSANEMRVLRRIGAAAQHPSRLHAAAARRGRSDPACCRRWRMPPTDAAGSISCRAASARSRSCSPTSAASPRSPRAGCPTTSCSSSTAISRRWDARSKAREGASTSSSATGSWRCSASRAVRRPAAARRSPPRG